ncbi:hypothetical protein, partial [Streptococcus pneumoniae]|uniref:hypothetical protein n=1 Tax=Streptococcus pneumoniae TaxID=1313 RepID=UPI001CBB77FC
VRDFPADADRAGEQAQAGDRVAHGGRAGDVLLVVQAGVRADEATDIVRGGSGGNGGKGRNGKEVPSS